MKNDWDTSKSWKNTEEEKGFKFTLAKREKGTSEKGWLWKKKFVCAYMEKKKIQALLVQSKLTFPTTNQTKRI